ncbi:hypothetical protein GEMRC1_008836 [Eukaryota sp. GEM-RC1]
MFQKLNHWFLGGFKLFVAFDTPLAFGLVVFLLATVVFLFPVASVVSVVSDDSIASVASVVSVVSDDSIVSVVSVVSVVSDDSIVSVASVVSGFSQAATFIFGVGKCISGRSVNSGRLKL